MTRVFVEPSGRVIRPFGDPPGDVLIRNRALADWQAQAIRDAGLTRVDSAEAPCLVIPDTLFTTGEVLRIFLERAAGRDAVLVLGDSMFGRRTTPVQPDVEPIATGWRFNAIRHVSARGDEPVDVVVDPDEVIRKIDLPTQFIDDDDMEFAVPRHPVMTLHHWVHILWANQTAPLVELRNTGKLRMLFSVVRAAVRAFSLNRWKILGRCNEIGRNCDIHPTAVIEISRLGDGVRVGAHARVTASTVGDGAMISSGAQVEASCIGERALVSQAVCVRFCVLYPRSVASFQLMQQCILGRGAVTTLGSGAIDLNFHQPIRVGLDGELHSSGSRFLGSAFGHDCRIGTGLYFAPGRDVPNGSFLVMEADRVIRRIPADLEGTGPLINDRGTVRPIGGKVD